MPPSNVEDVNLGNVSIRKDGQEAADELQLDAREELPSRLEAPILVLASAGRHEMLERCLRSLAALPGYRREQVLVSQDGADSRAQWVAEELFKVAWVLHDQESLLDFDARVTEHYREAISYALYKRFPTARSLLVVEEDMEAANDLLWYFAQLEPLLQEDPTLWCISAWNENCPAPFAADLTGLSRSDVFSGSLAWMLPAELYRKELLLRWPSRDWAQHFRSPVMAAGRQCLVPEVNRVRHLGRDTRKDTAKAPEAAALQDARMLVSGPLVDFTTAKQHVLPEVYREQMRMAVQQASPIKDLLHLPARLSGKHTERWQLLKGYRLMVQSVDRSGWEMVANFFKLSPAYPPTGLYHNLLRLRWGAGAVLFLVLGSSDFLEGGGGEVPVPAEAFRLAVPPVFVSAENVVAASKQDMGRSCTSLCESLGKVCYSADLLYLNSCTLLRQFHSCSRCEASHGADQPAFWSPQRGNRASGGCLYNSDILLHPPSCDAAHPETQRLCACRYPLMAAPMSDADSAAAPHVPSGGVDLAEEAARAKAVKASQKLAVTAEAAGWKPGLRAEAWHSKLMVFAPQDTAAMAEKPAAPLVLLLAPGDRAAAVRETLMSLKSLRNFDDRTLLISLGCCGAEAEKTKRMIEVDFPELLAKLKDLRYKRILRNEATLQKAAESVMERPYKLRNALSTPELLDAPSKCLQDARQRLGKVVGDKVQHAFLETSFAPARSFMRSSRLSKLRKEVSWARGYKEHFNPEVKGSVSFMEAATEALKAMQRAHALKEEAFRSAQLQDRENFTRSVRRRSFAKNEEEIVKLPGTREATPPRQPEEIVREAMRMLQKWKLHEEVAHVLCDALLSMAEALNRMVREDPAALETVAIWGGRELLEQVEEEWGEKDEMIYLHALNLRRRLKKTKVKSQVPKKKVTIPPADVMRIRGCFEAIDADGSGLIEEPELGLAFQMIGMKLNSKELHEKFVKADLTQNGVLEWPEFLFLMSQYSGDEGLESNFTEERLAELRDVFNLFDEDGSGSLDAEELNFVLRSVGLAPSESEVRRMIDEVDADGSGMIEWPEFLFLMSKNVVKPDEQHRFAFEFFDKGKEGKIQKDDFVKQMQSLSKDFTAEELEMMFEEAKFEDGDTEQLTYKEFVKMMMR